jgi:hypothetical protein
MGNENLLELFDLETIREFSSKMRSVFATTTFSTVIKNDNPIRVSLPEERNAEIASEEETVSPLTRGSPDGLNINLDSAVINIDKAVVNMTGGQAGSPVFVSGAQGRAPSGDSYDIDYDIDYPDMPSPVITQPGSGVWNGIPAKGSKPEKPYSDYSPDREKPDSKPFFEEHPKIKAALRSAGEWTALLGGGAIAIKTGLLKAGVKGAGKLAWRGLSAAAAGGESLAWRGVTGAGKLAWRGLSGAGKGIGGFVGKRATAAASRVAASPLGRAAANAGGSVARTIGGIGRVAGTSLASGGASTAARVAAGTAGGAALVGGAYLLHRLDENDKRQSLESGQITQGAQDSAEERFLSYFATGYFKNKPVNETVDKLRREYVESGMFANFEYRKKHGFDAIKEPGGLKAFESWLLNRQDQTKAFKIDKKNMNENQQAAEIARLLANRSENLDDRAELLGMERDTLQQKMEYTTRRSNQLKRRGILVYRDSAGRQLYRNMHMKEPPGGIPEGAAYREIQTHQGEVKVEKINPDGSRERMPSAAVVPGGRLEAPSVRTGLRAGLIDPYASRPDPLKQRKDDMRAELERQQQAEASPPPETTPAPVAPAAPEPGSPLVLPPVAPESGNKPPAERRETPTAAELELPTPVPPSMPEPVELPAEPAPTPVQPAMPEPPAVEAEPGNWPPAERQETPAIETMTPPQAQAPTPLRKPAAAPPPASAATSPVSGPGIDIMRPQADAGSFQQGPLARDARIRDIEREIRTITALVQQPPKIVIPPAPPAPAPSINVNAGGGGSSGQQIIYIPTPNMSTEIFVHGPGTNIS